MNNDDSDDLVVSYEKLSAKPEKTVLVEIDDGSIELWVEQAPKPADLPEDAVPTSPTVVDYSQYLLYLINSYPNFKHDVVQALAKVKPDELVAKIGIAFEGEAKVPLVAKGKMKVDFEMKGTWKKKPDDSAGSD